MVWVCDPERLQINRWSGHAGPLRCSRSVLGLNDADGRHALESPGNWRAIISPILKSNLLESTGVVVMVAS